MLDSVGTAIRRAGYAGRWVVANIIPLLLIIVIGWNAYLTANHVSLPAHHVSEARFQVLVEKVAVLEHRLEDLLTGKAGDRWALTRQMAPWADELHRRNPELDVPLPSLFQEPR